MRDMCGNNRRVLLVEDAGLLRYAFARLLRMYGFEVREAVDGREALDNLVDFQPELVLTDLMMPVMDGIELIRHLHGDPATAHLPIVAITADATEQAQRQAREAGAIDVITKPIDLPSLLERLRMLDVFDEGPVTTQIAVDRRELVSDEGDFSTIRGMTGSPVQDQK